MRSMPLYAIFGAGGAGRGIMPFARQVHAKTGLPNETLVFVDDSLAGRVVNGHAVMSASEFVEKLASSKFVALAVANSALREKLDSWMTSNGLKTWTVISDMAVVFDEVEIGDGALISPFATLTSNIRIGRHFHANLYSYIEHDCVVGDFVTLAPGAKVNGNIVLEDHVYVGSNAVIKQGRSGRPLIIGKGAVIGMGAVVTKNVPAGVTMIGNPARPMAKKA